MPGKLTLDAARRAVASSAEGRYSILLERGMLELGYYAPRGHDPQQPHTQDEIYIIVNGSGTFVRGEQRQPFEPGQALFVAAGETHRFEDFSDDFEAWVIFCGPEGGEKPE